jgi:hypothetical protein
MEETLVERLLSTTKRIRSDILMMISMLVFWVLKSYRLIVTNVVEEHTASIRAELRVLGSG